MTGRPRFVVLPHHLADFEKRRDAGLPPEKPVRRRRKHTDFIDYYPQYPG